MFQALNAGRIISKDLLFKDVRPQDRREHGERFPLGFVDWAANGDPFFYENHHLSPQPTSTRHAAASETWVFHGTPKFSGKRLVVEPGAAVELTEPGVYSVFVWSGSGTFAGHEVRGGHAGLDELLVSHDTATRPHRVVNTGREDLMLFSLFGPDLHPAVPAAGVGGG
jgi:hypothetical protein